VESRSISSSSSSCISNSSGSVSTTTNTPTTMNTKNKKNYSPQEQARRTTHPTAVQNHPTKPFNKATTSSTTSTTSSRAPPTGAPIVVKKYKLLFFTIPEVGCTVWKQLFRRVAGYADWQIHQDGRNNAKKATSPQSL
jgi:hypothetical protein